MAPTDPDETESVRWRGCVLTAARWVVAMQPVVNRGRVHRTRPFEHLGALIQLSPQSRRSLIVAFPTLL